ncbi:MAG: hypothetical protein JWR69_145 [Pedosphaera sp.]|nr:hypothetical protein [Pedosphaera sp.]
MKTRLLVFLAFCSAAMAGDLSRLCADRTAIERVYYNHRLGDKPPFEQTMPPARLEQLVQQDQHKEAMLKSAYGIEISTAQLAAEVNRINTTTQAPAILAEIKAALGDDPSRFSEILAKPILVERELRQRFDNDDALHAPRRQTVETVRAQLLAARHNGAAVTNLIALLRQAHSNEVSETIWQLGARPAETNAPDADLLEAQKRFGPNAQILSSPHLEGKDQKFYFADLPGELQNVLRVQLRQPGDVSAVIETPGGFLLYVAKEKTGTVLSVAGLSLPKRSYEEWLEKPTAGEP